MPKIEKFTFSFHAACTVDGWLEDTSVEGRPWPSLMGAFMKLLDEERTAHMHSQVPHREIHVAAKRVARRKKQEKRQSHLIFWPVLIAGLAIVVALLWR